MHLLKVSEKNGISKDVWEQNKVVFVILIGLLLGHLQLSAKEKESKKQERKVVVVSGTFSRALEALLSFAKALSWLAFILW
jgi:hypothetical protein